MNSMLILYSMVLAAKTGFQPAVVDLNDRLVISVMQNNVSKVQSLLKQGASPNAQDNSKYAELTEEIKANLRSAKLTLPQHKSVALIIALGAWDVQPESDATG